MGFGGSIPCAQSSGQRRLYEKWQTPVDIMAKGDYYKVPFMAGANPHEGLYVYGSKYFKTLKTHSV